MGDARGRWKIREAGTKLGLENGIILSGCMHSYSIVVSGQRTSIQEPIHSPRVISLFHISDIGMIRLATSKVRSLTPTFVTECQSLKPLPSPSTFLDRSASLGFFWLGSRLRAPKCQQKCRRLNQLSPTTNYRSSSRKLTGQWNQTLRR